MVEFASSWGIVGDPGNYCFANERIGGLLGSALVYPVYFGKSDDSLRSRIVGHERIDEARAMGPLVVLARVNLQRGEMTIDQARAKADEFARGG